MSFEITFDAKRPALLARFWAEALCGYTVRPYDQGEIDRLAALGRTPTTDPSVPIDGPGPTIWFQEVSLDLSGRSSVHLDLKYGSRLEESRRLINLGATVEHEREDHLVMLDIEGNRFCVFDL